VLTYELFILSEAGVEKLDDEHKIITAKFGDKVDDVQRYAEERRLSFDNAVDLRDVVQYYNWLSSNKGSKG
jgi:hypothetical protein